MFGGRTMRLRRSNAREPRLLLMIHGLKGDENSMWVFGGELSRTYLAIAPRAPHEVNGGGFSWRMLDPGERSRPGLDEFRGAAQDLVRDIDLYAASISVRASEFDIIGFSQGGTLAAVITLLQPARVRKAAVLSGFLPAGADEMLADRRLQGKPIFIAHGTRDETVPVAEARDAKKLLEGAGAQVTYCEDEVGHKVSAVCLRSLKTFLED